MSLRIEVKGWVPKEEPITAIIDTSIIESSLCAFTYHTKRDCMMFRGSAQHVKIVCTITVEDVKGGSSHD